MSAFTEVLAELDALQGPQTSAMLAEYAAEQRDAVIAADQPSSVLTIVDGRPGAALESVAATGSIVFEFGYTSSIAQEIFEMLIQASPYASKRPNAQPASHYRDEHLIMVNGTEVSELPADLPSDATVMFVNTQPYSRKIEAGLSMQAPSGVYEVVAALSRRRFGNSSVVDFSYVTMGGLGPISAERKAMMTKSRRSADDRFPSVTIKALAS